MTVVKCNHIWIPIMRVLNTYHDGSEIQPYVNTYYESCEYLSWRYWNTTICEYQLWELWIPIMTVVKNNHMWIPIMRVVNTYHDGSEIPSQLVENCAKVVGSQDLIYMNTFDYLSVITYYYTKTNHPRQRKTKHFFSRQPEDSEKT